VLFYCHRTYQATTHAREHSAGLRAPAGRRNLQAPASPYRRPRCRVRRRCYFASARDGVRRPQLTVGSCRRVPTLPAGWYSGHREPAEDPAHAVCKSGLSALLTLPSIDQEPTASRCARVRRYLGWGLGGGEPATLRRHSFDARASPSPPRDRSSSRSTRRERRASACRQASSHLSVRHQGTASRRQTAEVRGSAAVPHCEFPLPHIKFVASGRLTSGHECSGPTVQGRHNSAYPGRTPATPGRAECLPARHHARARARRKSVTSAHISAFPHPSARTHPCGDPGRAF
jgi:hypothetical protein